MRKCHSTTIGKGCRNKAFYYLMSVTPPWGAEPFSCTVDYLSHVSSAIYSTSLTESIEAIFTGSIVSIRATIYISDRQGQRCETIMTGPRYGMWFAFHFGKVSSTAAERSPNQS